LQNFWQTVGADAKSNVDVARQAGLTVQQNSLSIDEQVGNATALKNAVKH
jgi:hypothetical protein